MWQGPNESWCFTAVSGDPDDLCVFVARAPGPPLLCTFVGGRWLKPLPLPDAGYVSALARIDDEHWLVTGRSRDQRGFAAVFAALRWELHPLGVAETRAYIAASGQYERGLAIAVGAAGRIVEVEDRTVRCSELPTQVDLSSTAVDIVGRRWAGGAGALWVSAGDGQWTSAWSEPSWHAPFISLHADAGLVVALTVDGAVLENRSSRSEIGAAMVRRVSSPPRAR